jgi:hemin uptake protein HemP
MNGGDDQEELRNSEAGRVSNLRGRRVLISNNRLDSRDLFVGTREIVIAHGNDTYHLRLTGQNKLILTK